MLPAHVSRSAARAYFPALTGIRFPLSIWVIVHHLAGPREMLGGWMQSLPWPGQALIDTAYVAVGTFFVLSGFVLARGYGDTPWNRANLLRYGAARFARFYPVYVVSLVVLVPIMYGDLRRNPALGDAGDRVSLLLNYGLMLQGWVKLPVDWNTPAWSLSCELFFYLCFPVLILLLRPVSRSRVALLAALAMVLPAAVRAMGAPDSCKPVLFFGDFLMGMALAGISGPFRGHGGRLYLSGAALGLATILAGRAIPSWAVFDGALRLSNAAAVLGLAAGGGAAAAILSRSWMVLAGRASYAIYILHIPLLWWYKRTFLYYLLPGPAAAVVYIALVVAVSVAVTLWIEEPANRLIRDKARAWLRQDRETAAGAPERAGGLAIETAQ